LIDSLSNQMGNRVGHCESSVAARSIVVCTATGMHHDATSTLLADSSIGSVFIWSFVLIVLVVIGAAGVMRLRRWLKEDDDTTSSGGIGFTLSDLRQLHKQGQMTDEEFERARAKMVEAGRAMAAKMPHPLARPSDPTGQNRAAPPRAGRPQPPPIGGHRDPEDQ
jgi:hypothetical protein